MGKVEVFGPGDESDFGGGDETIVVDVGVDVGVSGVPTLPAQVVGLLQPTSAVPEPPAAMETSRETGWYSNPSPPPGWLPREADRPGTRRRCNSSSPRRRLPVVGIGHPGQRPCRPVGPPVGAGEVDPGRRHEPSSSSTRTFRRPVRTTVPSRGMGLVRSWACTSRLGRGLRVRLGVQRHKRACRFSGQ